MWRLLLTRMVVIFSERSIWGFQSPGVEHGSHPKVKWIRPVCCSRSPVCRVQLTNCLLQGRREGLVLGVMVVAVCFADGLSNEASHMVTGSHKAEEKAVQL